ncbi:hypothetical protein C8J57DRAFT_1232197 [Mycena rebaudengoi]|nr:hypothetical protein C8J57DRAFT_1232197 [Mycena rebaudengoi]
MAGVSVELVETPCDSLGSGHSSSVTGLPNWKSNKSWQNYNENSLYSLYCMAYKKSNFESNIKQHLPRHMLGYLQEKMGVDSSDTAKLGWSRGTYMDTYAPALPKNAILGTHGYKVHENYDPIWCHVRDPEAFLSRKCPNAERILEKIEAIYQVQPKSALFKLPALQNPDVRSWMSSVFPVDLKRLKDSEKDSEKEPLDLARIQNEALRLSLEEVRVQLVQQTRILERMEQKFERRTAVFSPAKGYSNEAYMTIHSLFTPMHKSWTPPQLLMQKRALVKTRDCMKLTTTLSGPFSVPHLPEIIVRCIEALEVSNEMTLTEVWKAWSSPEASISELEALRNHLAKRSAVGDEIILIPLGMNALAKHLTEQRKQLRPRLAQQAQSTGNGDGAEVTSLSTIPAKRKAPIASRAKSAKFPKRK